MKILTKILLSIFIFLLSLYLFLFFAVPKIFNSKLLQVKAISYISKKSNIQINFDNFNLKTSPLLVYSVKIENLNLNNSDKSLIKINHIYTIADLKTLKIQNLQIDTAFINADNLALVLPKQTKKKKPLKFNFKKLPKTVDIKNVSYISKTFVINNANLSLANKIAKFSTEVDTPLINNNIILSGGLLTIKDNNLFLNNCDLRLGSAKLTLSGNISDDSNNIYIKGKDLPIKDLEAMLLYFQKRTDLSKKFIENFINYKGLANVDLKINKNGIFGQCEIRDLYAESTLFNVPLSFKSVILKFNNGELTSNAIGTLGNAKVYHNLIVKDITTAQKEVFGTVKTTLNNNFNYIPELRIQNNANARIAYHIKNKKVGVDYNLEVNKGSDLIYKNISLGLEDKKRVFSAKTLKDGNELIIKEYKYSLFDSNSNYKEIIHGDGLYIKQNGKLKPSYFNCITNGYAPVSVIGSFGRYVYGGEFSGNLKFDILNEKIYGDFEVINTRFKDFYVKSAKVIARDNIKILADGFFHKQKFSCNLEAKNQFGDNPFVYNLDLFLDKFIVKKGKTKPHKRINIDISSKVRNLNITIQNWNIRVNSIIKDRIALDNITLYGKLQDNVFNFILNEVAFAKGTLSGDGRYDFNDDSSCINFKANNIDSNYVADIMFNLKNQIEGIANAKLHVDTKNKLNDVKAQAEFSILNGYLPQLGNQEVMFKNFKKGKSFKISELTNINFSAKESLSADIKGQFKLNNEMLEDINITTHQNRFASYINGRYNIVQQDADLNIYGKYDTPKGYKILFMPLDWILEFVFRKEEQLSLYQNEIKKIPDIISKKRNNEKFFRVKINGNLNTKQIDVDIKGLK